MAALLKNGGTVAAFSGRDDETRAALKSTRRAVLDMWALAAASDAAAVTADSTFALAASALFPKPTWVVGTGHNMSSVAELGCVRLESTEPSCKATSGRHGCG